MKGTFLEAREKGLCSRPTRVLSTQRDSGCSHVRRNGNPHRLPLCSFSKAGDHLLSTYCVLSTAANTRDVVQNRTKPRLSGRTPSNAGMIHRSQLYDTHVVLALHRARSQVLIRLIFIITITDSHLHFVEKTEAQRSQATCLRSQSWQVAKPGN